MLKCKTLWWRVIRISVRKPTAGYLRHSSVRAELTVLPCWLTLRVFKWIKTESWKYYLKLEASRFIINFAKFVVSGFWRAKSLWQITIPNSIRKLLMLSRIIWKLMSYQGSLNTQTGKNLSQILRILRQSLHSVSKSIREEDLVPISNNRSLNMIFLKINILNLNWMLWEPNRSCIW